VRSGSGRKQAKYYEAAAGRNKFLKEIVDRQEMIDKDTFSGQERIGGTCGQNGRYRRVIKPWTKLKTYTGAQLSAEPLKFTAFAALDLRGIGAVSACRRLSAATRHGSPAQVEA